MSDSVNTSKTDTNDTELSPDTLDDVAGGSAQEGGSEFINPQPLPPSRPDFINPQPLPPQR